jgi:two-component system, chemotaxis family, response regulator PixG
MILSHRKNTILSALELLEDFANRRATGLLKVSANDIFWFIYFNEGEVFHANFSIEPIDRLEFYMRQVLKSEDQRIEKSLMKMLREQTSGVLLDDFYPSHDYQTLYSLLSAQQISVANTALITKRMIKETICNFLLLAEFTYDFISDSRDFPLLFSNDFTALLKECRREITDWQSLKSNICSFYQRPLVCEKNENHGKYNYLKKFLVGKDFNHLSLALGQSAIKIAQRLDPLIASGVVDLLPPIAHYARLPQLFPSENNQDPLEEIVLSVDRCKVVSIDDSPTVLQRIDDFLDRDYFQNFSVQDANTALDKILVVQPHLILMDVDMPNIDGYNLCRMVRSNQTVKSTPIIMVAGNSSLVERAKAKISGATDYLTKPFTQDALNQMVFRHLKYH